MLNGKLYSVWTDNELSPVFNVYQDDTEALIAFRNLILTIRRDISSGAIEPDTDTRLSLYCHGFLCDGVIRGIKTPVHLFDGRCVEDEVIETDCEVVPALNESEVSE